MGKVLKAGGGDDAGSTEISGSGMCVCMTVRFFWVEI